MALHHSLMSDFLLSQNLNRLVTSGDLLWWVVTALWEKGLQCSMELLIICQHPKAGGGGGWPVENMDSCAIAVLVL